ncbi:MAG: YdbL family protein [bacterium]
MMKTINRGLLILLASLLMTSAALAIGLGPAKNQGLVGETPSGYLKPVGSPTAEVNQLITQINQKRRAEYNSIAKKNSTSLKNVEALAGKKAIDRSRPGEYVLIGGKWKKK